MLTYFFKNFIISLIESVVTKNLLFIFQGHFSLFYLYETLISLSRCLQIVSNFYIFIQGFSIANFSVSRPMKKKNTKSLSDKYCFVCFTDLPAFSLKSFIQFDNIDTFSIVIKVLNVSIWLLHDLKLKKTALEKILVSPG